jgi:hypothetical protein
MSDNDDERREHEEAPPEIPEIPAFEEQPTSSYSSLDEIIAGEQQEDEEAPAGSALEAQVDAYLVGCEGRVKGQRHPLPPNEKMGIGRDSSFCRIVVLDPKVSRLHCTVTYTNQRVRVEDSGSQNGTFIDGHRVEQANLPPGSRLRIGTCEFELEVEGG